MATPYFDFFTDTNGTQIHNHTADSGQSYSTNTGFKVQDNRLYCDDITNNLVEVQSYTTDTTFKADLNFRKVTDAGNMGITFGDSGSGFADGYLLRVNAGQQLRLWSLGPLTDKGTYNFTIADGQDFKVTIDASPGNVDIYLDDVLRLDPLVSPNTAAGKMFIRSNVVASSTTGYHLDSLAVYADTPPYPVEDYTVDVDGTDHGYLQYHTSDSSHTYAPNKGLRLDTNRLFTEDATIVETAVEGAICDVEYDIDMNFYRHTDTGSIGVIFGSDATLQTGFYLQATTPGRIGLWEFVSGTPTFRAAYSHGVADGNPIPVTHAEVRSGQIEVFVGGVSRFTHVTAVNKEGQMYIRGAGNTTATTGNHMSDVSYTAITNGAGGPLVYSDTFTQETTGVGAGTLSIVDVAANVAIQGPTSTITASSTIVSNIIGSINTTLDDFTLTASSSVINSGSLNETLDDMVWTGSGKVLASGSINTTLDDFTLTATGTVPIAGSMNVVLDDFTWLGGQPSDSFKDFLDSLEGPTRTHGLIDYLANLGFTGGVTDAFYEFLKTKSSRNSHSERFKEWESNGFI